MNCISADRIHTLRNLTENAGRVAVVGHTHPDGDVLGATAALALYLQSLPGKAVTCVFSDSPADNLRFLLPEGVSYRFHDTEPALAEAALREAELIFLIDANEFSRTEALRPLLEASPAPKILIDHHLNPDCARFNVIFSTPEISSASELLYWILKALGAEISNPVGTALLAGMTTDTNNFANSVFPSTLQMASELIASGVDRDALLDKIYRQYRENRVRMMGYMENEGLHVLPCGATYMLLTRAIQHRFDLREGESEGLVNVPLTIADVRLSILLKEDEGHFRVSIRSKKGTSAQQLAARFFHGGGHENAAGGKLFIGQDIPAAEEAAGYVENALNAFLG